MLLSLGHHLQDQLPSSTWTAPPFTSPETNAVSFLHSLFPLKPLGSCVEATAASQPQSSSHCCLPLALNGHCCWPFSSVTGALAPGWAKRNQVATPVLHTRHTPKWSSGSTCTPKMTVFFLPVAKFRENETVTPPPFQIANIWHIFHI